MQLGLHINLLFYSWTGLRYSYVLSVWKVDEATFQDLSVRKFLFFFVFNTFSYFFTTSPLLLGCGPPLSVLVRFHAPKYQSFTTNGRQNTNPLLSTVRVTTLMFPVNRT